MIVRCPERYPIDILYCAINNRMMWGILFWIIVCGFKILTSTWHMIGVATSQRTRVRVASLKYTKTLLTFHFVVINDAIWFGWQALREDINKLIRNSENRSLQPIYCVLKIVLQCWCFIYDYTHSQRHR